MSNSISGQIKRRRTRTSDEWRAIFKNWQSSGLSKTRYCRLEGITTSCFNRWYTQLMDEEKETKRVPSSQGSSYPDHGLTDTFLNRFVPVGVIPGRFKEGGHDLRLDIHLTTGHRICVESAGWDQVVGFLTRAVGC